MFKYWCLIEFIYAFRSMQVKEEPEFSESYLVSES